MRWVRHWDVPSETSADTRYTVSQADTLQFGCSCPAWKFARKGERRDCKHIRKVRLQLAAATPPAPAAASAAAPLPGSARRGDGRPRLRDVLKTPGLTAATNPSMGALDDLLNGFLKGDLS